jgi:hypothetical protein
MNFANIGRHTIAAPLAALTLVAGGGIALAASGGPGPAPPSSSSSVIRSPGPSSVIAVMIASIDSYRPEVRSGWVIPVGEYTPGRMSGPSASIQTSRSPSSPWP